MSLAKDYCFTSERLRFRGIEVHDAEDIVRWRSNPENYKNFLDPRPITLESHLAWFERYLGDSTRYDFLIENNEGFPIGTCGLSAIAENSCEISYMIGDASARGKGYATEAVMALSEVAFRELGVQFIEARILPHNDASTRVVTKCGYDEVERVYKLSKQ